MLFESIPIIRHINGLFVFLNMTNSVDVFFKYHLLDFLIVLILIGIWYYTTKRNPHHFYIPKSDPRLSYPHYNSGITEAQNLIIVIGVPYLVYLIFYLILKIHGKTKFLISFDLFLILIGHFGCIASGNILANCIKVQVGRPRPDYYAVLGFESRADSIKPDGISVKKYQEEYKSFPSGHSCSSMSGGLFFTFFLNGVLNTNQFWVYVLTMLPILYVFYVACTRILQHRHHVEDVLGGLLIGFIFPCIFFYGVKNIFGENLLP